MSTAPAAAATRADRVIVSERVVTNGRVVCAAVHIHRGKILAVTELPAGSTSNSAALQFNADTVDNVGNLLVMPGVVDCHVHINEPGRTHWEGFDTATRAAAVGGITTLVDMPLNSIPPTVDMAAFDEKKRFARGVNWVDLAFWGGIIPGNQLKLKPLVEQGGARGFKCFLCPSGVDEFPMVTEKDLHLAFQELVKIEAKCVFLFHAERELEGEAAAALHASTCSGSGADGSHDPRHYRTFLHSRPGSMEEFGIETVIEFCRKYRFPCHIVHLSSADCLPLIVKAKSEGLPLTVETCHHYLTLKADEINDGATEFKCCPPIRDDSNRMRLWEALKSGVIDMVVSDHSPSVEAIKCRHSGDFMKAWGGISSVQFGLSVFLTNALEMGVEYPAMCRWLCENTAKLAGLEHIKGRIAPGFDADIAIVDDMSSFKVEVATTQHKNKTSPYLGRMLRGVVMETVLRGETIYKDKALVAPAPSGILLIDPNFAANKPSRM